LPGAPRAGEVFSYTKSVQSGNIGQEWDQAPSLQYQEQLGDLMGTSVAISGSTLLIGTPGESIGANAGQGFVTVNTVTGVRCTAQPLCSAG
jgi:hypothetical protein